MNKYEDISREISKINKYLLHLFATVYIINNTR